MADHPLRPATDRRLGEPLPHQLANPTSAAPRARGPKVPRFPAHRICGISVTFATLSPTPGYVPMHYSPVRHSPPGASSRAAVRLACVRHAASVQSEPGSNSSVQSLLKTRLTDVNSSFLELHLCKRSIFCLTCVSTSNQAPTPIGCLLFKELSANSTTYRSFAALP